MARRPGFRIEPKRRSKSSNRPKRHTCDCNAPTLRFLARLGWFLIFKNILINFPRLIHSPTQLSTFDQSIREAQLALDSVAQLRRDFSDRWRDLERLMHTQLRSRSQQDQYNATPSTTRKNDDEQTSQRLSGLFKFASPKKTSKRPSLISIDSKIGINISGEVVSTVVIVIYSRMGVSIKNFIELFN